MASIHDTVYGKTTLSDIFKEIHINQKEKNRQIDKLIEDLSKLVSNLNDATVVIPLIREYLDAGIKNDEQLIKMAGVFQRLLSIEAKSRDVNQDQTDWLISPDELKQLTNDANQIKSDLKTTTNLVPTNNNVQQH